MDRDMNCAHMHSTACHDLLSEGELADAVRYCVAQGIEPPVPPCAKDAPDYERCVALAKATLSDYGWWEKRLKVRDARSRRRAEKAAMFERVFRVLPGKGTI